MITLSVYRCFPSMMGRQKALRIARRSTICNGRDVWNLKEQSRLVFTIEQMSEKVMHSSLKQI